MPDYTNVPAAGEELPADKAETDTKDMSPKPGETQEDEKMDIYEKDVEEKDNTEKINEPKDGGSKEIAMEVDDQTENVQDKTEKLESKSDTTDVENVEPDSKIDASSVKQNLKTSENKTDIKDTDTKHKKETETEVNDNTGVMDNGLDKDQKGTEDCEDVDMVESDDSVLEAFKTAQTLLEGLSPCKDGVGALEKKDSVDGITGPASDKTAKSDEVQDLTEKLKEIEKELNVIKDSNAKTSEPYEQSTQGPAVNVQDQTRISTAGPFGSAVEQNIQKDITLTKSSSFGFTPSLFPEPSIHPSQPNLSPLAMPAAPSPLARSQPQFCPLAMPSSPLSSARSSLIGPTQVSSPLIGQSQVASPLFGISSPLIGRSPGTSPLVGRMSGASPLAGQMSSALPLSSPLFGPRFVTSPLIGQISDALPLAGMPPMSSPLIGPQSVTSPLIGQISPALPLAGMPPMSSPLIGPQSVTSPLIGQMSSALPLVGPFSGQSSLIGTLSTASGLIGQGPSSSGVAGHPARTSLVTQDHGYTIPALSVIPAPNLNISISQPTVAHTSASSPHKHSPILTSYLTSSGSYSTTTQAQTLGSSQSPLKRQNSGGFGQVSMATENRQTGLGADYPSNLNVPVTQSLHKSLDTPTTPTSLFIADFDDQSPGGRRGQKRKRISMATEEIMMYGKRRSARVGLYDQ